MSLTRQLSLFGVEARPPSPLDLEGLLAGAGQVSRMGGTARVSIVVEDAWRAAVLQDECALRGLVATSEPADGRFAVRTAYSSVLSSLAAHWLQGVTKHPPAGFFLDGRRLRLWVAAAGSFDGVQAFVLRLALTAPGPASDADPEPADGPDPGDRIEGDSTEPDPSPPNLPKAQQAAQDEPQHIEPEDWGDHDAGDWPDSGVDDLPTVVLDPTTPPPSVDPEPDAVGDPVVEVDAGPSWEAVGSALAAAGLSATLIVPRAGGAAYRIVGRRRLARLAELIGDPPKLAPPDAWPR